MASPMCDCGHSARVHSSPTKCGAYGCKCTGYKPGQASNPVSYPVQSRPAPIARPEVGSGFGTPPITREVTDRQGNTAILPVVRHDDMMMSAIKKASTHAIAQIQTGTWSKADMAKLGEIGKLRGCGTCESYTRWQSNRLDSTHLTPQHVAWIFGVNLTDIREDAYAQIIELLDTGATAEPMSQLIGWRQYDLQMSKGGLRTRDGSWVPEFGTDRPFLSGAQGNYWVSGKYAALCAKGLNPDAPRWRREVENARIALDPYNEMLIRQMGHTIPEAESAHYYMEAAKAQCREHYGQSVGTRVDATTLAITRATDECTCGAYAVSDRARIMGEDGDTQAGTSFGYSERKRLSTVKAVVWGYGLCHVGADGKSWRATNAMVDSLIFYPEVKINNMAAPTASVSDAWARYAKRVDFEALALDLAVYYDCPVTFASETKKVEWDAQQLSWVYEDKVEAVVQPPSASGLDWLSGVKA